MLITNEQPMLHEDQYKNENTLCRLQAKCEQ